jgi:kynurenine formamidase
MTPVIGIDGKSALRNLTNVKLTALAWVKHGGIVGRGVLIDYASWATKNSIPLSPFTTTKIPLSAIKQIVEENDIRFRPGDILFLRTGFTTAYDKLSADEELAISQRETPQFAGLESGEATLRWLWENQFAAVASDSPSFEPSPIAGPQGPPEFQLHQWLLAGWGMPIGEYFDLEGVAEYCAKTNRWSFFLSSVPLKVS